MPEIRKKYRFLLIRPFRLPTDKTDVPKETGLQRYNYDEIKPLLEDVEWDYSFGALTSWGDWPVENREEFCLAAAGRLPIVREACESGKYNAIVLLGGGEPGFRRSIARS